ncbi:hypothetical protein DVR14_12585 [Natrinema thermotolerans]|nr:hypothetical protein DVR14_12585 [Natrinema thermotolerans]
MHTSRDTSCAYLESIRRLNRRSSPTIRQIPPVVGRNGPSSESKKLGFRGSCVRACESGPTATTRTDGMRSNGQLTSTTATRRKRS